MFRHARVDLFGQADEARVKSMLASFPRQIMRVERNAVTADSRARIKRHKPEWIRCGCTNHFPDINVQRVTESGHFIGHPDVYRPECVLQQLSGFGYASGRHRMNVSYDLRIKMRCNLG